jgi:hypothetical protein
MTEPNAAEVRIETQTDATADVAVSQADTETPSAQDAPYNGPDRRRGPRTERRKTVVDRRLGLDRRRGPGKRRSDGRRSAEEGEMTDEQFEFLMAVEEYKRVNSRPFPTWTEVLDIIHAMGYRKVADPEQVR